MSTDEFRSTSANESDAEDAKKRRLNEADTFDHTEQSKRRRPVASSDIPEGDINVKILVPTKMAGEIIGKSGETIATLEKETHCQIKISRATELFPKTTERVILIMGKFQKVFEVVTFIQEKIGDRRDLPVAADPFDYKQTERSLELKMVIPGSAAGGVIGKGGDFVRSVEEANGVHVQMSTKAQTVELGTDERVVTLAGSEVRQLVQGAQMLIIKISQYSSFHAPSYLNINYNCARFSSSDRPYNSGGDRHSHWGPGRPSAFEFDQSPMSSSSTRSNRPSAALAPAGDWFGSGGVGNLQVLQFLDGLSHMLRNNGFNEPAVGDIMQAMHTLARYNVLGLGLGFGLSALSEGIARNGGQSSGFLPVAGDTRHSDIEGGLSRSGISRGRSSPSELSDDRRSGTRASYAESLLKVVRQEPNFLEMRVSDAVAGALLGKQGSRMNEVQLITGATIDISKRKPGEERQGPGGRKPERQLIIEGSPEAIEAARQGLIVALTEEMMRYQNS